MVNVTLVAGAIGGSVAVAWIAYIIWQDKKETDAKEKSVNVVCPKCKHEFSRG